MAKIVRYMSSENRRKAIEKQNEHKINQLLRGWICGCLSVVKNPR